MAKLDLVEITKNYNMQGRGIFALNLTVNAGEFMVLLGPSGCGKTTTMRIIAGLVTPDSGDLCFDGRSMLGVPPERRGATMVFQQHALFPFFSVGENVAYGLKLRKLPRVEIRQQVASALQMVQLEGYEDRWPYQLSGGQCQRVALARALAVAPKVLLLDEPFSSLETELREELRETILRLHRNLETTIVFVTHDQIEAVALADRIALLFDGRLHQVASPRFFYEAPKTTSVVNFFGGANLVPGIKDGSTVHTSLGPLATVDKTLPNGRVVVTIRPEAIEVGANGVNTLHGTIRMHTYYGPVARCCIDVNGMSLQVAVPPHTAFEIGSGVDLHLPPERIYLLPPDSHDRS